MNIVECNVKKLWIASGIERMFMFISSPKSTMEFWNCGELTDTKFTYTPTLVLQPFSSTLLDWHWFLVGLPLDMVVMQLVFLACHFCNVCDWHVTVFSKYNFFGMQNSVLVLTWISLQLGGTHSLEKPSLFSLLTKSNGSFWKLLWFCFCSIIVFAILLASMLLTLVALGDMCWTALACPLTTRKHVDSSKSNRLFMSCYGWCIFLHSLSMLGCGLYCSFNNFTKLPLIWATVLASVVIKTTQRNGAGPGPITSFHLWKWFHHDVMWESFATKHLPKALPFCKAEYHQHWVKHELNCNVTTSWQDKHFFAVTMTFNIQDMASVSIDHNLSQWNLMFSMVNLDKQSMLWPGITSKTLVGY